jgi:bifunctional NMN adenylyltransferase/nudix hydrolase
MVKSLYDGLSATDVRNSIFLKKADWFDKVPKPVFDWIMNWTKEHSDIFENLVNEYEYIIQYKKQWENSPYSPIFITTDSVVICNNHILLIKRKNLPGKDLFALPGGFLEENEFIESGCIRELFEETNINVSYLELKESIEEVKYIDNPNRDPRGRIITFAHKFKLFTPSMPHIEAKDDAIEVMWVSINNLKNMEGQFFNDHLQIINYFIR